MSTDFGISGEDWNAIPQSVKGVVFALKQQAWLVEIRFSAGKVILSVLKAKDAGIGSLKTEGGHELAARERIGFLMTRSFCPARLREFINAASPPTVSH